MQKIISSLFEIGPLLFGVGFVAPVFAALVEASGYTLPFAIAPLHAGLVLGIIAGLIATKRGSWI
jgi:hypothetical protein